MNHPQVPEAGTPAGFPDPDNPVPPRAATPAVPSKFDTATPAMPPKPVIAPKAAQAPRAGKASRAPKAPKAQRAAKVPRVPRATKAAKPATPGKRRGGKVAAMVVAGVVLFGGGIWLGTAVTDPTASEQYVALDASAQATQKELAQTSSDRQVVQDELDSLKSEVTSREAAADTKSAAADQHESDVKAAEAALKGREAAVKKREDAVTGAEAKKAANTVGDGTWVVGVDIEPGTYKANADVGASCYWGIYASGSNGDDIINNDIPGGGKPSVTLSAGQDFKSSRCGSWTKQ